MVDGHDVGAGLRAVVVPARSDEHDAAAAAISHLPHLLAEALAITAAEVPLAFALAAGSFRDATRVAGTAPDLVRAMCEGNSSQLVPSADRVIDLLSRARDSLAAHNSVARADRSRPRRTNAVRQLPTLRHHHHSSSARRTGARNSPQRAGPAG